MVRVRYAPSPTGSPHVGNIRTALFNFLFARSEGGRFIVRIEDTDQTRKVEGALEDILASLRWLGIEWDEGPEIGGEFGPYFQSQRLKIYQHHADELLKKGAAYRCFCTPQELEEMREYQRINKIPQMYDRRCRGKTADEIGKELASGKPFVVRLAMPLQGKIAFEDAVRGRVEYEASLIDDQVLLKSDGWPTYHLANVVDDHLQQISHVIRGDEWINSTPKHVVLYQAFGWEPPIFAHAPIIKGADGAKLSKRHGDTRCLDYREKGYLAEAVANFIALIGWSPGDNREIMRIQELEAAFSLQGIQPSPGVFDLQKLQWMNGEYIRALSKEQLYEVVAAFDANTKDEQYLESASRAVFSQALKKGDKDYVMRALALEQERVKLLTEFPEACEFFFVDHVRFDDQGVAKWKGQPHIEALMNFYLEHLADKTEMSAEDCEQMVNAAVERLGLLKRALAIHPTRVALTGRSFGPGLFELMALLGAARMKTRFEIAKNVLNA